MAIDYEGKEFNDPILRCTQCSKLTHRKYISHNAACVHCGNKRFKNVRGMNWDEYTGLQAGTLDIGLKKPFNIDPDFLACFEQKPDVDDTPTELDAHVED